MIPSLKLVLIVLCGLFAEAHADEAPRPKWMSEVTTFKPGKFKLLAPCELEYQLSWNGILKAGEATVQLGLKDAKGRKDVLLGTCKGRSAGLAKQFWYYKNSFESVTRKSTLRPVYFLSQEIEKKEKVTTRADFVGGVVKSRETVEQRKGAPNSKTKERVFAFDQSHDMLSALLYLRSLPLNDNDEITMVVHPFKSAYLTKFRVLGREKFKTSLGIKNAIKLEIKLHKIGSNMELKSYKKFKSAKIWFSDDLFRLPLEVRSEVFIGSVRATLEARKFLN